MLSELHQKWLESRKIDLNQAIHMDICSARRGEDGRVIPDDKGDILCMPYRRDGEEVAVKYRGPSKKFWQKENGLKQFFNRDILLDPVLYDGTHHLCIVEGEMDALAVMSAGYPWVVSVPDGAPPPRDGDGQLIRVPDGTADINPETDTKFSYLLADWELLSKVKKIVIAVDSDEAGRRLSAELVRRLDPVRCSFVTFPEDCKDLNDVLIKHGPHKVTETIKGAKPVPINGLYKASDFPPQPPLETVSTGWRGLDDILRPYLGAFMVVGGFPGHGKSSWTMQLAAKLAKNYSWNIAIASFEMQIVPYVTDSIMSGYLDSPYKSAAQQSKDRAQAFLEKRFSFIVPNRLDQDTDHDIDWLLDKMQSAVIREGVKMVLIDPFNEIEHRKKNDETLTEYIGRAIRKLKAFALQYNVLVVVVVHPTKAASAIESEDLSLYNLADSSHWANKADIGVIVGRIGDPTIETGTGIYVKKIRYQPDAGTIGEAILNFDRSTRLFYG